MESFPAQLKRSAQRCRVPLLAWLVIALGLAAGGVVSWTAFLWQPVLQVSLLIAWRLGVILRFACQLSSSDEFPGRRVLLRLAPELRGRVDPASLLERWDALVESLAVRLGEQPAQRPIVQICPSFTALERVLGEGVPTAVLVPARTLVVAVEALGCGILSEEMMRHEVARLLIASWGPGRPLLKERGLTTWLQGTHGGEPIDLFALRAILDRPDLKLLTLAAPAQFAASLDEAHFIAGSFTGYLVQRFGWSVYRQWYSQPPAQAFGVAFQRVFGESLEVAEASWREALLARRPELQPELDTLRQRQAVKGASQAEQWQAALERLEELREAGTLRSLDLQNAFSCHLRLGDYARAIEVLETRLVAGEVDAFDVGAAPVWLHLAGLYRNEGSPEKAENAYLRCLESPDAPDSCDRWCHDQAQRGLERLRARSSKGH